MTNAASNDVPHGLPIVDAHQHFWDLRRNLYPWLASPPWLPFRYGDYAAIRRNYLPEDYAADTAGFRVVKSVHMEAECDPRDPVAETRWLEEVRTVHGRPNAYVVQARLDRDDIEDVLARQAAFGRVRGVRHKPQASPSPTDVRRGEPGSMDDPKWRQGYALLERHGFSFDLQVPDWDLAAAAELARDFPRTPIIVNHTALPMDRSPEGLRRWKKALEQIAACSNINMKISGLGQPGGRWPVEGNRQIVRRAIEIMGVRRCLFASNYPVDRLVASFSTIFEGFRSFVADYSPADQRRLFHDNAVDLYRL